MSEEWYDERFIKGRLTNYGLKTRDSAAPRLTEGTDSLLGTVSSSPPPGWGDGALQEHLGRSDIQ